MLTSLRAAMVLLLGIPFPLAAEPIHVMGRVQPGEGQERVEARVELLPQTGEAPVAVAKTDAAGFFELAAPESGCFRMRLQAQGYASLENPLLPVTGETALEVPLVRPADARTPGLKLSDGWVVAAPGGAPPPPATPRTLQGKVSDAKGAPAPGALVWSVSSPAVPCVKAGTDGTFQIHLPASGEARVRAAAPGYLASAPQTPAPGVPFLLKLQEAGAIAGQVVDAEGHPLARVHVMALPVQWDASAPGYGVAWSQADGRFRLSPLPQGGLYEVMASRDGLAPSSLKAGAIARDRPPAPVRIVLESGAAAFGRVVDREGKPVPDAHLALQAREEGTTGMFGLEDGPYVAGTTTDAQGGFAFQHLNPGRLRLRIERKGFAPFAPVEVEIPKTGRADLGTFKLDRGLAIEGRVLDPRGVPVPGVRVDLRPTVLVFSEAEMRNAFQEQTTDSTGRFRFEDLRRGARFDVSATSPGHVPASVESVEAPTPEPVTITLKAGRSLSGRVTGPAGEPVRKAEISLQEERTVRSSLGEFKANAARPLGTTDEDGGFRVQGVAPGAADLQVRARGYRARSQSVQVPEDGDVEGLEISLEKAGVFEVHVLDASGAPVPGADAWLTRLDLRDWSRPGVSGCRTEADGRCRMENLDLEPGGYRLSVRSESRGHAETTFELKPGVIARDVVLHKGVEVSGRVSDDAGDPVPGADLSLQPAGLGADPLKASSSADGSFRFPDVDDGTFRLSGSAPGFGDVQAPGEIQVAGQEIRGLELRFSKGTRVTGKLLGLDPEEAKGVIIMAIRPDLTSPQPALGEVDPDGRYRIESLGPGDWTVTAIAHTIGRSIQEPLHLAPGVRETVLDLRFQSGFTLSGRVLVDQAPLAGAQVFAFAPTRSSQALTGPDGGFQLADLPAGPYVLIALDSGGELSARRSVEVTGDQEVTFEVTTGRLRGRISAAGTGAPVEGALLHLEEVVAPGLTGPLFPSGPGFARTTDASGLFEASRISAGLYKITVEKEGFAPATVSVQVSPGAVAAVEIELKPAP